MSQGHPELSMRAPGPGREAALSQTERASGVMAVPPPSRRAWRMALALAAYAVIGWLIWRGIDRETFALGFNRLRAWHVAVILLSVFGHIGVRALRFDRLLRSAGANLHYRLRDGVRLFLLGLSASAVTPGRAGDLIKARLVRDYGIAWNRGLGLVLVERMLDLLSICSSLAIAAVVLSGRASKHGLLATSLLLLGCLVGGCLVLITPALREPLLRVAARMAARLFRSLGQEQILQHLHEMLAVWDDVFRSPLRFGLYFAGSALAWSIEFCRLWIVLWCLGQPMDPWIAFFVYPASILAGLLSLLPFSDAVLGVTGAVLLHALAGINEGLATTAIVVDRTAAVVPPLLLWGVFALVSRRRLTAGTAL